MFEIALCSVIVALLVEIAYLTKSHQVEIDKLVKALIAKNLTELDQSVILDKVDTKKKSESTDEFIPIEEADESTFNKNLKEINGGQRFNSEV